MSPLRKVSVTGLMFIFVIITAFISSSTASETKTRFAGREADASCVCVPYYNCNNDNTIITNGHGLTNIRTNEKSNFDREVLCDDIMEVCCRLPPPANVSTCGRRRINEFQQLLPRLDKEVANDAEFPWMVTIFRRILTQEKNETVEKTIYQCQGTLISKTVVLTAAQCVSKNRNDNETLLIHVGQDDTMMTKDELVYQEHEVRKVIVHHKYDPISLRRNVALLVLQKAVEINRHVDIACLVHSEDLMDGDKCLLIGWDKFLGPEDVRTQRSQTNVLKRRLEPFVPQAACQTSLRQTLLGKRFKLASSFICAGGILGTNFCSREIGAPLACPLKRNPSQYVQVGIASWCINSGNIQTPSVFTSVSNHRQWIDAQMKKEHIDSSDYRATKY